ncbi:hypothetical protein [Pyxidicoccus trucidator]|uniref:hypothetical protein n=1 Tax=Pyxidicoccus trucidator TaxID=2709662 RepID=UPI0013DAA4BF|nr:hypothetical protein [Pyxidicoccus trucidator]
MRAPVLVAALLLLGALQVQAAGDGAARQYTQGSEGFVYIKDVSELTTRARKHTRAAWTPIFQLTIELENRLDVEVFDLQFELTYRASGSSPYKDRLHDGVIMEARAQRQLIRGFPMDDSKPVGTNPILVSYRLFADPARSPGVTRTLLLLANSRGQLDVAVAANLFPHLGPDATLVREEVRAWVTGGVAKLDASIGAGIAPMFALRLLGRVGTGEDVSLLLSVLKSGQDYLSARDSLKALHASLPGHPMTQLFASGPTLDRVVEDALRDMRPELSAPALVVLAYQDGPLRNEAQAALRTWRTETLVEALRGLRAAEVLQVLCASRAPEAVPLIVGLGAQGVEGVDLKACLSALPEKETVAALVGALGEDLGPLEDTVLSLVEGRGRTARELLRARALKLGLPVGTDPATLARAIHARLTSQRVGALRATLTQVEAALREGQFDTALSLLDTASKEARGREEVAKVVVARARAAQAAARAKQLEPVARVLKGIPVPRAGLEHHADLEPELMELIRVLMSQREEREVSGRLDRIESLARTSSRPELARVYMTSLGEGRQDWERAAYAKRALALDSGNVSARQLVEEYEREQAHARWLRSMAINAGWLVLLGVFAWFFVSRLRAAV